MYWKQIFIFRYFFRQSGRSRGCAPSPQNRLKEQQENISFFSFFASTWNKKEQHKKMKTKITKKSKNYLKQNKKAKKNIHTIYLFCWTTLIRKMYPCNFIYIQGCWLKTTFIFKFLWTCLFSPLYLSLNNIISQGRIFGHFSTVGKNCGC